MPFNVTRHDSQSPFRPAFWAGLLFCLLAPTLLVPAVDFLVGALSYTAWLSDPWNKFGPSATFSDAAVRELLTRTRIEWAARLVPVVLCAAFWCLVHVRRARLVSPWIFLSVAFVLTLLIALIAVPVAAYQLDPRSRAAFDWATKWLGGAGASPESWPAYLQMFAVFLSRSFAWLQMALGARPSTALSTGISTYLWLVPTTWLFARAVLAYATWRNAFTLGAVLSTAGADIGAWIVGAIRRFTWLGGLRRLSQPTAGERVARAVAAPWLIPAVCALTFILVNKVFNLFPLALALLVLTAYAVARLAWRFGETLNITSYRLGGAALGFACAIIAMIVCSTTSIQSWVFLLHAGDAPKYSLLVSYLPPYVATIISIERGLRLGWRSASVTPPLSAASPPA